MEKYSITTRKKLEDLCVANNWLTEITLNQFTKIFRANEVGCSMYTIALMIWMCSPDACVRDIAEALKLAHREYEINEEAADDG